MELKIRHRWKMIAGLPDAFRSFLKITDDCTRHFRFLENPKVVVHADVPEFK